MKYIQITLIFLVGICGGSTRGDDEAATVPLKDFEELQDRFEKFFRDSLTEFRKLYNSTEKLFASVGKLQKDLDTTTVELSSLRVDFVQINENLKSLTEFTLAIQNYETKFPKADVYSQSYQRNLPGKSKKVYIPGHRFPGQCNDVQEFPIRSIKTYGTCIRLYTEYGCSGVNLMVSPVSYDQNNFQDVAVKSMGPCSLYENRIHTAK